MTQHSPIHFTRMTDSGPERKLAEWADDEMDFVSVPTCPIDPEHKRHKRARDLSIRLPALPLDDMVWTWYSECLLQDHVLDLFRAKGLTGFTTKPVEARFKKGGAAPPRLTELVVTGWGGMASPESGIKVVERCPGCNRAYYCHATNPAELIDPGQWDGSDFFMVWPIPKSIFVTARVATLVREAGLTGCRFINLSELFPNPRNPSVDTLCPGWLSMYLPEDLARQRGEASGILEI